MVICNRTCFPFILSLIYIFPHSYSHHVQPKVPGNGQAQTRRQRRMWRDRWTDGPIWEIPVYDDIPFVVVSGAQYFSHSLINLSGQSELFIRKKFVINNRNMWILWLGSWQILLVSKTVSFNEYHCRRLEEIQRLKGQLSYFRYRLEECYGK